MSDEKKPALRPYQSFIADSLKGLDAKISETLRDKMKTALEAVKGSTFHSGGIVGFDLANIRPTGPAISGKKADVLIVDDVQNPCAEIPLPVNFTVQRTQAQPKGQEWEMVAVGPSNHPIPPQITTYQGHDLSQNPEVEPGVRARMHAGSREIIVSGADKAAVERVANEIRQSHKTLTFAQMYGGQNLLGGARRSAQLTSIQPIQNSFAQMAQAFNAMGLSAEEMRQALGGLNAKDFKDQYQQTWPESKHRPLMILTHRINEARDMIRDLPEHERKRVPIVSEPRDLHGRRPEQYHIAIHHSFENHPKAEEMIEILTQRAIQPAAVMRSMPRIHCRDADGEDFFPIRAYHQISNLRTVYVPEDVAIAEFQDVERLAIRMENETSRTVETVRLVKRFASGMTLCVLIEATHEQLEHLPEDDIDLSGEL